MFAELNKITPPNAAQITKDFMAKVLRSQDMKNAFIGGVTGYEEAVAESWDPVHGSVEFATINATRWHSSVWKAYVFVYNNLSAITAEPWADLSKNMCHVTVSSRSERRCQYKLMLIPIQTFCRHYRN